MRLADLPTPLVSALNVILHAWGAHSSTSTMVDWRRPFPRKANHSPKNASPSSSVPTPGRKTFPAGIEVLHDAQHSEVE